MSRQTHNAQRAKTSKQTLKDWLKTSTTGNRILISWCYYKASHTLAMLLLYHTTDIHILEKTSWMQENKSTPGRVCSPHPLPFLPTRPTSTRSNRWRWNTTWRQGWQRGGGKGWRQWMEYTKDESDARAEEKEPCRQHFFLHWVLMRLHIIRKTKRDRSKQSTTRRICPEPSPPFLPSRSTSTCSNS